MMKNLIATLIAVATSSLLSFNLTHAQDGNGYSGEWQKAEVSTKGGWRIDGSTLTLENLTTKRGPDLKIILSPHKVDDLKSRNAMEGAIVVSPLSSSKGNQTYVLPDSINLEDYQSIGIHCERFTKLFAKSSL